MEGESNIKEFTSSRSSLSKRHLIPRTGEIISRNSEIEQLRVEVEELRKYRSDTAAELNELRDTRSQLQKVVARYKKEEQQYGRRDVSSIMKENERLNTDIQTFIAESERQKVLIVITLAKNLFLLYVIRKLSGITKIN
jgi:uncharacterized coiled-coil DUF342 family protein